LHAVYAPRVGLAPADAAVDGEGRGPHQVSAGLVVLGLLEGHGTILDAGLEHYNENCECIFCRMNKEESEFKQRVICENEDFIAYIPFFADYAYGIYISAKKHKQYITDFTESERKNLGIIMRNIVGMYDNIFDFNFPYMMCMHNAPVNLDDEKHKDFDKYTHFHVEYYPPLRDSNKQQFQASSETGVWAHCNPTAPEEKAAEMREALKRYLAKINK
ncbi:MAG: hypothetical protein IJD67_03660, partial [Clostridia bacterium]|nr:hypothetical protein [Clostridia bacterium]